MMSQRDASDEEQILRFFPAGRLFIRLQQFVLISFVLSE
jgi:hypothetical protein